jgi:hypothetical protein
MSFSSIWIKGVAEREAMGEGMERVIIHHYATSGEARHFGACRSVSYAFVVEELLDDREADDAPFAKADIGILTGNYQLCDTFTFEVAGGAVDLPYRCVDLTVSC